MPKPAIVIANVGTSIVGNYLRSHDEGPSEQLLSELEELKSDHDARTVAEGKGHEAPERAIVQTLSDWAHREGPSASAELESLAAIHEQCESDGNDLLEVSLLATDTVDGVVAAKAVQDIVEDSYDRIHASIHRIAGLQVENGSEFARFGLPGYIEAIYNVLEAHPPTSFRRIFNPTGGFKSVVPYLTIIAMLEDAETRYIYERSDDLLNLRPLPVTFDEELLSRGLPVLEETESKGTLDRDAIEARLELDQPLRTTPYGSLWTHLGDEEYVLSGLGKILLQRNQNESDPVFVSKQARDDVDGLDYAKRHEVERGLRRLHSAGLRSSGNHEKYSPDKTDCFCLGDSQSPYRIFYSEQNSGTGTTKIRVVRVFHLDEHDKKDRIVDGPGIFSDEGEAYKPLDTVLNN